uniref:ZP domain-containing protein n=1 Tax=Romanomermis culicivorax TaxID=13658 RepID=A0A915JQA5_ROMCU
MVGYGGRGHSHGSQIMRIEEVSCSAESMTVVLNKTDPTLSKWLGDPESNPVIYIQGNKGKADCDRAIKSSSGKQNIISLNFTVVYGQTCHVHLTDLYFLAQCTTLGPNFQSSETTVVLENSVQNVATPKSVANHIFCLYSKRIETINLNEISNNNEVIASIGGKPKPKVQMVFRDSTGKPLKSAKFGDPVGLYLMLSRDSKQKKLKSEIK